MRLAPGLVLAAAAGVCAVAVGSPALAARIQKAKADKPPATTEGRLTTKDGKQVVDVPLQHTEVKIHASGYLASVEVEQVFKNPYDKKIEAVYLFPLPTGAAVNSMEIEIGGRVIVGEIDERAQAKATYVKARREGLVAALLTQERPNLFTQNVANLEPGAEVKVRLRYLEPLAYADGGYEIVFPMVAGPRYVPKTSKAAADAEAVQPSVLPPDVRSSHDIGLTVDIDAGVAIAGIASPSHQIVQTAGATGAQSHITLAAGDTIPNKDFVLRYDVAGARPSFAVLAHRDGGQGSFFLMMQPPKDAAPAEIAPREIVFVVDTSSSMKGAPLAKSKELVHRLLATLGPDDTFQIVRFADAASALGDKPIANKPKNVEYALAWVDALDAGGGTEMTEGIEAALDFPHDPARLRLVVFVTDGYVGNEDEILKAVHEHLGAARLYSFGVGSAVNRYLLEEMAGFGRGALQVVRPDEDTTAAVEKFRARVAQPVLTDVTIDWGGLAVADVTPAAVPDLFVGQPIVLSGHYAAGGTATVKVHGMMGGRAVSFDVAVELPESNRQPEIATVWARARIAELDRAGIRGVTDGIKAEITKLALEHHLMSRYTAFVAVDRTRVTKGGEGQRVAVPVEVPDGLNYSGGGGTVYGIGGGGGGIGYGSSYGSLGGGSYSSGIATESLDGGGGGHYALKSADKNIDFDDPAPLAARDPVAQPAEPKDTKGGDGEEQARADTVNDASGAPDQHSYTAVVDKNKAKLRSVFDAALKADASLGGKFVFEITIARDGSVAQVTVESLPDGQQALAGALAAEIHKWKFPAGSDVTVISLPFVFVAKEPQK